MGVCSMCTRHIIGIHDKHNVIQSSDLIIVRHTTATPLQQAVINQAASFYWVCGKILYMTVTTVYPRLIEVQFICRPVGLFQTKFEIHCWYSIVAPNNTTVVQFTREVVRWNSQNSFGVKCHPCCQLTAHYVVVSYTLWCLERNSKEEKQQMSWNDTHIFPCLPFSFFGSSHNVSGYCGCLCYIKVGLPGCLCGLLDCINLSSLRGNSLPDNAVFMLVC